MRLMPPGPDLPNYCVHYQTVMDLAPIHLDPVVPAKRGPFVRLLKDDKTVSLRYAREQWESKRASERASMETH